MVSNSILLKRLIEKSKKEDICISEELYNLFVQEKETIDTLFTTIQQQRDKGTAKINMTNLISEQIGEIHVPQRGLIREEVSLWREIIQTRNKGVDIDKEDIKKIEAYTRKYTKYFNNGRQIPKRLDAFLVRPEGIAAIYEIFQDCYEQEIFHNLGYKNQEEIFENLKSTTMNIEQINALYKGHKLKPNQFYAMFCLIDNKIIIINFFSRDNKTFKRWPGKVEKGTKLLVFTPTKQSNNHPMFSKNYRVNII